MGGVRRGGGRGRDWVLGIGDWIGWGGDRE